MKYIRTKDGIYKYKSKDDFYVIRDTFSCSYWQIKDDEIIAAAETIWELCDEFVLFREGKPYALVPNDENNAKLLVHDVWKDYRGAIWTEWGLKYVAKKNKGGELELL